MEKPPHDSVISHPTEKECYGNTERRAIITTEGSRRCFSLNYILDISHMVKTMLGMFIL